MLCAQPAQEAGFYAGAGIGQASIDSDFGFDGSDTAFKLYAGYAFNEFFAAELAYINGGTIEKRFPDPVDPETLEVDSNVYDLSLVATLPLTEMFSLFGRIGYASYEIDETLTELPQNGGRQRDSREEQDFTYGAGAAVHFGGPFQLRAEYAAVNLSLGDFHFLLLSGQWKF